MVEPPEEDLESGNTSSSPSCTSNDTNLIVSKEVDDDQEKVPTDHQEETLENDETVDINANEDNDHEPIVESKEELTHDDYVHKKEKIIDIVENLSLDHQDETVEYNQ